MKTKESTRLTKTQVDDLGFETNLLKMNEFKKLLKENERIILFNDERFKRFFFYDNVEKIMYKCSWGENRVVYRVMKKQLFGRRELIWNTSKHKPYDLFYYRIYNVAVEFYKDDETLKYGLDYQMKKVVENNDRLLTKKLHA